MNKSLTLFAAAVLAASTALPMQASAELEELQVHGQIRIRGNYLTPGFLPRGSVFGGPEAFGFDDDASTDDFYNALVEVNFTADMSDDVTGYIALRSYDIFGGPEGFGDNDDSNPSDSDSVLQGLRASQIGVPRFTTDFAGAGNDAVGVYQAYIQMDNVGGYPVSVKLGRQEISLGREFLVGNNDASVDFSGMAFDALRVTYDNDENFMVTAFTAKLVENRNLEEDADVDLHAIYATYYGLEALDIDAYWIWLDNGAGAGTPLGGGPAPGGLPLGDDSENLHTIGLRVYGTAMDDRLRWNAEFAYQFGDVNDPGITFGGQTPSFQSLDVDAFAINVLVGYTFDDAAYRPEVHLEYAFFSGDDDIFDNDHEAFTRLFSDVHYGKINLGGFFDEQTTNMHIIRVGGSAEATDALTLHGDLLFFILAEDDQNAVPGVAGLTAGGRVFGGTQFGAPGFGGSDDYAGTELDLWATWQYSEDLVLAAGWSHFFVGDALETAFATSIAPGFNEGEDDLDYLWWQAHLLF